MGNHTRRERVYLYLQEPYHSLATWMCTSLHHSPTSSEVLRGRIWCSWLCTALSSQHGGLSQWWKAQASSPPTTSHCRIDPSPPWNTEEQKHKQFKSINKEQCKVCQTKHGRNMQTTYQRLSKNYGCVFLTKVKVKKVMPHLSQRFKGINRVATYSLLIQIWILHSCIMPVRGLIYMYKTNELCKCPHHWISKKIENKK